jgi:hypothetical protein
MVYSLQPSATTLSPRGAPYKDGRNDIFNKGSTYKHPQNLPLNAECLMTGRDKSEGFPSTLATQHNFLTSIPTCHQI